MGKLYGLIQDYMDAQPLGGKPADIARALGVSRQTISNWREPTQLISRDHLMALAQLIGVPYLRLLDALLEDIGYIPTRDNKLPSDESGQRGESA